MKETSSAVVDRSAADGSRSAAGAAAPDNLAPSSDDSLKQWLELVMTGPRTATVTVRKALEMTQRLVHAPYDLGRSFVQSSVLVDVDVDVDIASRAPTT